MTTDFRAYEATPGISVIVLTDAPVFTLVTVSNDFIRATGMKKEDVINKGRFEIFPATGIHLNSTGEQNLRNSFDHIIRHKEPHEISSLRYDTPNSDGSFSKKHWKINNAPVLNDNGEVLYIVHSAVEITDRVNADQSGTIAEMYAPGTLASEDEVWELEHSAQVLAMHKVEESVQQVRSLVESAPFPIGVYIGREMRIEFANRSILDVWGKGDDVIGKLYSQILPELDNQEIFSQLDRVFTSGIPFHARNQRVDLQVNGLLQIYFFNYSFTPLYNAAHNVYGVMNTAADVTDLNLAKQQVEQSEKNFRNMILQAPVAMCILIGPSHIVEVANESMIALWGKPATAVLNKPVFEGLPDAREQGLENLLANVYQTGDTFKADERPIHLVRGGRQETVYQNFAYEPYKDAEGNILGVLAISVDVTEQVLARQKIEETVVQRTRELRDANEALLKINQELKRSNASLEEFTYAASHDLKEPIRKILIFMQCLKESLGVKMSENDRQFCERIEVASNRMGSLIDDLLAYSEVSANSTSEEIVDLNEVISQVLNDLDLEIEQKKAIVKVGRLASLKGRRRQLQQAFCNLISNALKYSKAGVVSVIEIEGSWIEEKGKKLLLSEADQHKKYYQISVADNGIGFEQEFAEHIFKMFTRLHSLRKFKGTGVGLAIVRKVIENHHGYIWAEGRLGEGATFNVLLPAG